MVVSYTNNYGYTDAYANKGYNNITTNGDGGGNNGGGAFMKMFEDQEAEDSKKEDDTPEESTNPLDNIYGTQYYTGQNVIRDYIDNSLLLNTEQVACTNLTQHLVLKRNVKETLKFLNLQAAKNMVNSRKYNYNFQTTPQKVSQQQNKMISDKENIESENVNFFEKSYPNRGKNFFIS